MQEKTMLGQFENMRNVVKEITDSCDTLDFLLKRAGEITEDVERPNRYYVALPGEPDTRRIFQDGQYIGSYDPNLAEVLS